MEWARSRTMFMWLLRDERDAMRVNRHGELDEVEAAETKSTYTHVHNGRA